MPLDREILTDMIPKLFADQEAAHRARKDLNRLHTAISHGHDDPLDHLQESSTEEEAKDTLEYTLRQYFVSLLVTLDASGLAENANRLRQEWQCFVSTDLKETQWSDELDYTSSPALIFLDETFEAVRSLAGKPAIEAEFKKLESILRQTASILKEEKVIPRNECDVQRVMHKYLRVYYGGLGFSTNITLPKSIASFKPDSGIADLKVALEFKFVTNENEAKTAVRGVIEDVGGYSGSLDWTRFYAVIYQTTAACVPEDRYKRDIERTGDINWKCIVVTGDGTRKSKDTQAKAAPPNDPTGE